MPTLRELGEFEVIRRLAAARVAPAERRGAGVVLDAGDDAALLRPNPRVDLAVTTDAFVEGAHFRTDWSSPAEAGARLAAANLSDLAAMAARPRWALLSLGARPESSADDLVAFQSGLSSALAAAGAWLVGGNLTSSSGNAWYSLTLVGECPRGAAWTRAGARPGDLLAVTGHPGRAGAGLRLASGLGLVARVHWSRLLESWLVPSARVDLALELRDARGITAAVDVSDGFAGDLAHLCAASGVGAVIEEPAWPVDKLLARAAAALEVEWDALRFGPSDDYELILAVDPSARGRCARIARTAGVPLAFVGHLEGRPDRIVVRDARGGERPLGGGYDHFARRDALGTRPR